jgi:hypothetical protein
MTYDELSASEGRTVDVRNGQLVLSDGGFLTLSRTPGLYSAYINDNDKTVTPIVPQSEYKGHAYKLRTRDCVSIVGRWLDENIGTDLLSVYRSASNQKFSRYYFGDFGEWFAENGFDLVDAPQHGDVVFYEVEGMRNHLGIYLDGGKILHHIPRKYSGVDDVDPALIRRVYRYAKQAATN